MTVALILAGCVVVLGLVVLVLVSACVCGARDDRMMEAWRAERERANAAVGEDEAVVDFTPGGWRLR